MVTMHLPSLREKHKADFCVVNGENCAGGFGITEENAESLFDAGADVITSGNHIWNRKETGDLMLREPRLLRPANYPSGAPGGGFYVADTPAGPVAVMNLMGRVFMPPVECPFLEAERIIKRISSGTRVILVDFHAEATSEKQALAWYLDGRVAAVAGTHTHVPTADARVLPGGTALVTDLGMVGVADSVIGVDVGSVVDRFVSGMPGRLPVADGDEVIFNSVMIEIDEATKCATSIERIDRKVLVT